MNSNLKIFFSTKLFTPAIFLMYVALIHVVNIPRRIVAIGVHITSMK